MKVRSGTKYYRNKNQMADLIYLDNNATTPCDPRVVEAMLPYFSEIYGNPANGLHRQGRMAAKAVDEAREQVANLIGARASEITFTGGATESDNLTILGLARSANNTNRRKIVTSAIEHKAILEPCHKLSQAGFEVVFLPVDLNGVTSLDAAREAIDDQTLLVSLQAANNEIGVIQPVQQIAELAHSHGAWMHCDAAQAVGKIPTLVDQLDVDLLSISAHKLYGPKGVGALYIRTRARRSGLEPLTYGGGQEGGLRPGTSNVPAIIGLGKACLLAQETIPEEIDRIALLRDQLETQLQQNIPSLRVNGQSVPRLPNTSNLLFPDVEADALLLNLPEIMLCTGSACTSGAMEPSHVLQAMGLSRLEAHRVVRASLGRFTTETEILKAANQIYSGWDFVRKSMSDR